MIHMPKETRMYFSKAEHNMKMKEISISLKVCLCFLCKFIMSILVRLMYYISIKIKLLLFCLQRIETFGKKYNIFLA